MLIELFQEAGFDPRSAKLLSLLAEGEELSALDLVRLSDLPRSTAYLIIEDLLRQGAIESTQRGRESIYRLAHPKRFSQIVAEEQDRIRLRGQAADQLAKLLLERDRSAFLLPRLHFVSGKREIEEFLFENVGKWRQTFGERREWWGYQDDVFVEQYQRWLEHAWSTTTADETVKLLSNRTSVKQEKGRKIGGRTIRPLPAGFSIDTTLWSVGEYLVMITTRTRPHYCYELRDANFSGNLRNIFRFLWELSS